MGSLGTGFVDSVMKVLSMRFCFVVLCALWLHTGAWAQGNVLGLPAVPQTPVVAPAPPAPPASGASNSKKAASNPKAKSATATVGTTPMANDGIINDADAKSVLNGGVTMASSYTATQAQVMVTTNAPYKTTEARQAALQAARLVQRDLFLSCGRHCKPLPMAAAHILPDGKLQFPMAIDGLGRVLSYDDMMGMLLGKPLAVVAVAPIKPATAAASNVRVKE